ncbi:MAG: hypothetical protein KatS3mg010_1754 [Acidimicrobiia bacterium]|nr:MAG: hypothetical protein KatS3mg010_1754 [Acidimicrobiia bacterium]
MPSDARSSSIASAVGLKDAALGDELGLPGGEQARANGRVGGRQRLEPDPPVSIAPSGLAGPDAEGAGDGLRGVAVAAPREGSGRFDAFPGLRGESVDERSDSTELPGQANGIVA